MKAGVASTLARRSGFAAVLGATLWGGGVGADLMHNTEDGSSILNLPLFLTYVGSMVIGTALLVAALIGLRTLHRAEGVDVGRVGRVGFRIAIFGMSMLVLFGVVYIVGGLITRETIEAAFLLFALGFLALIVAHVRSRSAYAAAGWSVRAGSLRSPAWRRPSSRSRLPRIPTTTSDSSSTSAPGSRSAAPCSHAPPGARPCRPRPRPGPDPA